MSGRNGGRWVIHLPIGVPDLLRARVFARTATRLLLQLSRTVDVGEVTVSREDEQGVHHRVFCDRLLAGGGRCALPTEHRAPCTARRNQRNARAW
ncbi:hypothetical protein AWW66_21100 [Micromonospora rosaria]|uniref:Uncharacterized protein n=1 Tax=Micromonospora rosaria TaxID=47874 RepID=A0A136PNR1_9ACTN|nr:hypothetical protein [Micromonospora rosaria]KXK60014.1 hypothetical protein AWW66_21100 [Micromonospora rosaria]